MVADPQALISIQLQKTCENLLKIEKKLAQLKVT
jgi:hypothetical protein